MAPEAFVVRGGAAELIQSRDREVLLCGPAGTGKTYAICWWAHVLASKYAQSRLLFVRKTLRSLTSSTLVTYQKVLGDRPPVRFYGGSAKEPASFRYFNGTRLVLGGMDDPEKLLSSEYDLIYVNEATELSLEDWEILTTRLRNGVMPHPRLVGDCNPTHSKHWLLQRASSGRLRYIQSRIEDNPAYYDDEGNVTPAGQAYIDTLDQLSGTRYQRFRLGVWVGVENAVYDVFERRRHLVPVRQDVEYVDGAIGVDFGDVHPHAAVAVSLTGAGRLVVREAWAGRSFEELALTVERMRRAYGIARVRVDPMLRGWEHAAQSPIGGSVERADGSPGARRRRIDAVYQLLQDGALTLDVAGEGNLELADEIEMYHYVHRSSDTVDELVVARVNDDRVAALEYAVEELDVGLQATWPEDLGADVVGTRQRAIVFGGRV